jgi:hypothetical protein
MPEIRTNAYGLAPADPSDDGRLEKLPHAGFVVSMRLAVAASSLAESLEELHHAGMKLISMPAALREKIGIARADE